MKSVIGNEDCHARVLQNIEFNPPILRRVSVRTRIEIIGTLLEAFALSYTADRHYEWLGTDGLYSAMPDHGGDNQIQDRQNQAPKDSGTETLQVDSRDERSHQPQHECVDNQKE